MNIDYLRVSWPKGKVIDPPEGEHLILPNGLIRPAPKWYFRSFIGLTIEIRERGSWDVPYGYRLWKNIDSIIPRLEL